MCNDWSFPELPKYELRYIRDTRESLANSEKWTFLRLSLPCRVRRHVTGPKMDLSWWEQMHHFRCDSQDAPNRPWKVESCFVAEQRVPVTRLRERAIVVRAGFHPLGASARVNRRGACFGQYRLFRARSPDAANGRQDVDLHATHGWRETLTALAGKSMFDESTVNLPRVWEINLLQS